MFTVPADAHKVQQFIYLFILKKVTMQKSSGTTMNRTVILFTVFMWVITYQFSLDPDLLMQTIMFWEWIYSL